MNVKQNLNRERKVCPYCYSTCITKISKRYQDLKFVKNKKHKKHAKNYRCDRCKQYFDTPSVIKQKEQWYKVRGLKYENYKNLF